MSPMSVFPKWLVDALDSLVAGDVDGWMSMYAPDAVHEFPFAPKDGVRRLDGREAIAAYVSQVVNKGRLRFGTFSNICVRETGDEIIVEADGNHQRICDDTPVVLSYVWFITRRDGRVTHFRDYVNPMQLSNALDVSGHSASKPGTTP
jgi:ketosteroid isomerase-like protein